MNHNHGFVSVFVHGEDVTTSTGQRSKVGAPVAPIGRFISGLFLTYVSASLTKGSSEENDTAPAATRWNKLPAVRTACGRLNVVWQAGAAPNAEVTRRRLMFHKLKTKLQDMLKWSLTVDFYSYLVVVLHISITIQSKLIFNNNTDTKVFNLNVICMRCFLFKRNGASPTCWYIAANMGRYVIFTFALKMPEGYVLIAVYLFMYLFIYLFICVLFAKLKKYLTELHEIWWDDCLLSGDQLMRFWDRSGQRSRVKGQEQVKIFRRTQKVLNRIAWNLVGWLFIIRGPVD